MLNGILIKQFLRTERRPRVWLAMQLGISASLLEKMLGGHVPKDETLSALSQVIGVPREMLLLSPKQKAQTA